MSRSPGWSRPRTRGRSASWPAAVRGIVTPAARQAAQVSPEQSKAWGPWAPQRYGLPRWARAKATARAARAPSPAAGARPGRPMAGSSASPPATRPRTVRAWGAARVARTVTTTSTATPPSSGRRWRGYRCGGGWVAPAGRPRPHRGRPQAIRPRRPRRAGRRRPWAAAWWRACSARAWAAVVRHRLRQRQRRQRAWCGSQPRPRSSTRNGTAAAASARPPRASGGQAVRDGGMPAHAASPPLGPGPPRVRWRRWRARSTARSCSAAAGSWRRRLAGHARGGPGAGLAVGRQPPATAAPVELAGRLDLAAARTALGLGTAHAAASSVGKAASSSASNRSTGSSTNRSLSSRSSRART